MKWERVKQLGCELPEVDEGIWFRTPCLRVRSKSFVRLKEDGKSVVFLLSSVEEQEILIEAQSDIYFITDHYKGWPAVLARLSKLTTAECRYRLEQAWRLKAPRRLVAEKDADARPTRSNRRNRSNKNK